MRGLSLVVESGGYSLLWCTGFSLRWLLLLQSTGSRHVGFSSCGLQVLERRLSSCGALAYLLRGMWDLPGPGLEPVSPALDSQPLRHQGSPTLSLKWILHYRLTESSVSIRATCSCGLEFTCLSWQELTVLISSQLHAQ